MQARSTSWRSLPTVTAPSHVHGITPCASGTWRAAKTLRTLESQDAVALSADGCRALSGSWDNTLHLWDLESGQTLRTFEGHTSRVTAVAFTRDGHRALSGSDDNTLRLWDLKDG